MENNFFTATEALKRAYEDIEKTHSIVEVGGVEIFRVPNRTEFYASVLGFKEPTLSERLLNYYKSQDETFSSKEDDESNNIISAQKDADTVEYILNNLDHNLPDVNSEHYKLTQEELDDKQDGLMTNESSIIEIPGFGESFTIDSNLHNQNILEPKEKKKE